MKVKKGLIAEKRQHARSKFTRSNATLADFIAQPKINVLQEETCDQAGCSGCASRGRPTSVVIQPSDELRPDGLINSRVQGSSNGDNRTTTSHSRRGLRAGNPRIENKVYEAVLPFSRPNALELASMITSEVPESQILKALKTPGDFRKIARPFLDILDAEKKMLTIPRTVTEIGRTTKAGASDNNPRPIVESTLPVGYATEKSDVEFIDAAILEVDGGRHDLLVAEGEPAEYEETEIEVTMDSGAGSNVMPPGAVPGYVPRPSSGSRNGKHFLAADGQVIENEGEADIQFTNAEGRDLESTFQFADITRPLYGTGPVCDNGSTCIFTAGECRVLKGPVKVVGGREVARFYRKPGGLYNARMTVRKPKESGNNASKPDFIRQGR